MTRIYINHVWNANLILILFWVVVMTAGVLLLSPQNTFIIGELSDAPSLISRKSDLAPKCSQSISISSTSIIIVVPMTWVTR